MSNPASKIPCVTFNNGLKCPVLGLGTFKSEPGEVAQAVKDAIDCGYRHFDCAPLYGNEKEVGSALKSKIQEGVVKRDELFITSKLWNTFHKKESVKPALKATLDSLGLEYLDLFLMHTPMGYQEGGGLMPVDDNDMFIASDSDLIETWKAMEECFKAGLTKSIGVSNFNSQQIQRILDNATVKPVTNQVECHIYLNQRKLIEFCKAHNIIVTGYAPLGSPGYKGQQNTGLEPPLKNPTVEKIAAKYNKSAGQILIKFCIQRGIISIPKSVTKSRIQSNIDIFDFTLSSDDLKELETLDCNGRAFSFRQGMNHKDYPFKIDF